MRPYAWRHTYATWCLDAGINTFLLARRMGTSIAMIDRTYGHVLSDSADAERDLLDRYDGRPASPSAQVEAFARAWGGSEMGLRG